MRPLMLLLLSLPLLLGALALLTAPTSPAELLLPPQAQWTWVHRLRVAGFATDCKNNLGGASGLVTTDVLPDGRVRMICTLSAVRHLPRVG